MKIKNMQLLIVTLVSLLVLSIICGGCSAKPPKNTPPSILWLNGTYAVLTKVNENDVYRWGGMKPITTDKQIELNSIKEWWEVTNKEEMDETIDSLVAGRHNPRLLAELEYYDIISMDKEIFAEALQDVDNRLDVLFFQNIFDAYQRFGENAIFAWDLSRAVQLCADGYIAGFYSYEESTAKARKIGEIIQNTFDSWDDFYASYFYGYAYWSEDDIEDNNSNYTKRIKILDELKKDANGPLGLDWRLDLSE